MRRTLSPHPLQRIFQIGLMLLALALGATAQAQGIEMTSMEARRVEGALTLDFSVKLTLTHAVDDALQRGLPMYFIAQAAVLRNRWYWRDERVVRASRSWRLAFQPLTSTWRVSSLGGLAQSYPTLTEALASLTRVAGWRLVEADKLEAGERYYIEFSFQLDNSQLPRPMQLDLGQDWKLGVERTLRVEP